MLLILYCKAQNQQVELDIFSSFHFKLHTNRVSELSTHLTPEKCFGMTVMIKSKNVCWNNWIRDQVVH